MKKQSLFLFAIFANLFACLTTLLAVDYPIISLGLSGGWGQNELTSGAFGRIFLRYSLEAYIPGFQIDVGYTKSFYKSLSEIVISNPDSIVDKRTIKTKIYDNYPAIAGTFHLRPFGESTIIYFGGGAQIHFLSSDQKTTDRYWDEIGEKYQETELDKVTLLNKTKFGYHLLGGLGFMLGKFGNLDLEIRQTFLNLTAEDWDDVEASKLWGGKSWNSFSMHLGLTIYIF